MTKNKRFIIKPYEDTFNKVIIDELDQYRFPPLQHDFSNVRFRNALNGLWEHNQELSEMNEQLKFTLAFRSNQLALMENLIDDLGSEEMKRQMEVILNDRE